MLGILYISDFQVILTKEIMEMYTLDELFEISPYALEREQKHRILTDIVKNLSLVHRANCMEYRRLLGTFHMDPATVDSYEQLMMIPVRLFKEYELCSVDRKEIFKTMTSSGTSGQRVSKIFLDRKTSANQTKALVKTMEDFLGKKRRPMLILDTKAVIKNRSLFSARGAGILGFSMLGYDTTYALNENMQLDYSVVKAFLEKHQGEDLFLFGFTYIIWKHFYKELLNDGKTLNISNGILLHGGGFKKLLSEAVDNDAYKRCLEEVCGLQHIYNYYGMVEQTGSIYIECECGHLHASNFSDVIIRNPKDFSICPMGEKGMIELVSVLPTSYPGHVILTEDEGVILGEDDCPCGRKGKYFKILGRIRNAEIRGCSDTYERP